MAYNVTGVIGANAYVLTAAATGPQASDVCGDLTLDEHGRQDAHDRRRHRLQLGHRAVAPGDSESRS